MKEENHISSTRGDKVFTVVNGFFIALFTIVTLYPLIYVLSASISSPDAVNSGQMWLWPVGINFRGYARVFRDPDIWLGYRNTLFYTFFGTLISLAITLTCAYALTVKKLPGRKFFNGLFLFTMFFGGGIIPLYMLLKDLHLYNTIWAVLLPPAASIWNIIITRTFFESSIPPGLEEAAEIDGCNVFQKFFRIILPLSAPIIAVMALFYGVGRWNSYFNEMMFLRNSSLYPLQVFLRELLIVTQINNSSQVMGSEELKTMAEQAKLASIMKYSIMIVATLPVIIIYPFLQRYFVKGVMVGSIKG